MIETCRPRQWVKNLLVFAAPLVARTLNEKTVVVDTMIVFIAFCAASSAMYLTNDLRDRVADSAHSRKRKRPIASGRLPPHIAWITATMLTLVSLILASLVSLGSFVVVTIYLVSTSVYSIYLKRIPILELIILASGFVLRALAGATAAHVPPSKWFLLCVLFGSLFIAIKKRSAEMPSACIYPSTRHVLVWYSSHVLSVMARIIGFLFVFAYLGWSIAADHRNPEQFALRILSTAPFAIAVARYEHQATGENGESPEDLFANDRFLQLLGVMWFALVSASIYLAQ